MSARIIDGFQIAANVRSDVAKETEELKSQGITPTLAVVLVGDDPASQSYVKGKTKALHEVGMEDKTYRLPATTTQEELLKLIEELNADKSVNGILVQLPVPKQIDPDAIIAAIDPMKDVDGFHPKNIGAMFLGHETYIPCTPYGVVHLLQTEGIQTKGAHAVVVGRSNIVGKPLSALLADRSVNCTVTICHSATKNLAEITKQADILIAAIGKPRFITADMIKKDAIVIDVGVNRVEDSSKKSGFRLVGDVDFEPAKEVASAITPVPRGVGPMTIAMLMKNTLIAARRQNNIK
ncbi:MAG: bifunctional methylenetetrahydrofolate dehydrogenase/methenyltetrahydrofolate cyclohydrolase FolD [Treponema sp.]|nr:MAG: bifunctional methylenetetrahydrofolate dehydrogenase/methenyltetrahydrofolate cyclohydrolase FolD [Treponema sp.]